MPRRSSNKSVSITLNVTAKIHSDIANFILTSIAGYADKAMTSEMRDRLRAVVAYNTDTAVSKISKYDLEEALSCNSEDILHGRKYDGALDFVKRLLSSPLSQKLDLYDLSRLIDGDDDVPDDLLDAFNKMTTAQVAKDWPEVHEVQAMIVADSEKEMLERQKSDEREAKERAKREAARLKEQFNPSSMIDILRGMGYEITKAAPSKKVKVATAKKSK